MNIFHLLYTSLRSHADLALARSVAITGEEDEDTRHQLRCKLYVLEKEGGWKERGTGMFKLNVNIDTAKPRLCACPSLLVSARALWVSADHPASHPHSDASGRSPSSDPKRRAVPGHELRAAGQVGAVQCVRGRPAVAPRRPCWFSQVGGGTGECSTTRKKRFR